MLLDHNWFTAQFLQIKQSSSCVPNQVSKLPTRLLACRPRCRWLPLCLTKKRKQLDPDIRSYAVLPKRDFPQKHWKELAKNYEAEFTPILPVTIIEIISRTMNSVIFILCVFEVQIQLSTSAFYHSFHTQGVRSYRPVSSRHSFSSPMSRYSSSQTSHSYGPVSRYSPQSKSSYIQTQIYNPQQSTQSWRSSSSKGNPQRKIDKKKQFLSSKIQLKRNFLRAKTDLVRKVLAPKFQLKQDIFNAKLKFKKNLFEAKRNFIKPIIQLKKKKLDFIGGLLQKKVNFLKSIFGRRWNRC